MTSSTYMAIMKLVNNQLNYCYYPQCHQRCLHEMTSVFIDFSAVAPSINRTQLLNILSVFKVSPGCLVVFLCWQLSCSLLPYNPQVYLIVRCNWEIKTRGIIAHCIIPSFYDFVVTSSQSKRCGRFMWVWSSSGVSVGAIKILIACCLSPWVRKHDSESIIRKS